MIWTINYLKSAQKDIKNFDNQTKQRIKMFIEERLANIHNPRQLGEALKGAKLGDLWKFRVGDYRIICDIQDKKLIILVVQMGHRKKVYR